MLDRLSRDPKNIVVVVDVSSRVTMDVWFRERLEGRRVLLVAENGYCCSWRKAGISVGGRFVGRL